MVTNLFFFCSKKMVMSLSRLTNKYTEISLRSIEFDKNQNFGI